MAHRVGVPPPAKSRLECWGFRLLQQGLAQYHAADNTDTKRVQPTVHEIEQVRVHN
jgi:hypothetical protein